MKLCVNCRHYNTEVHGACSAKSRRIQNPVDGSFTFPGTIHAANARADENFCGYDGSLWEPLTVIEKPSLWARLFGAINFGIDPMDKGCRNNRPTTPRPDITPAPQK